jgi:DNA modification methylase
VIYDKNDIPADLQQYFVRSEIGLEDTPEQFIAKLVEVFREVRRVLRANGTCWLNLGDTYVGKQILLLPARVALALQADGWCVRQDIIWHKPNAMPEKVKDRCTKAHEYLFLLSKGERYYFDGAAIHEPATGTDERPQQRRAKELAAQHGLTEAHFAAIRACGATDAGKATSTQTGYGRNAAVVRELAAQAKAALGGYYREFLMAPTRNRRSVWTIRNQPYKGAHLAVFPPELVEWCVRASTRPGDVVLDPFLGSGTTAAVAASLGRGWVGCELNPDYEPLQRERLMGQTLGLEFA